MLRVGGHVVWNTRTARLAHETPDPYPTDPETGMLLVSPMVYRGRPPLQESGAEWVDSRTGIAHRVMDHMEPHAWATYERVAKWFALAGPEELRVLVAAGAVDAGVLTGSATRRYRVVSTAAVERALHAHRNPVVMHVARRRVQTYRKPARAAR
jgi:hypothetical protein